MRVISGSTGAELEDIREYDHLMSMLSDCQISAQHRAFQGYKEGYGNVGASFFPGLAAVAEHKIQTAVSQEEIKTASIAGGPVNVIIHQDAIPARDAVPAVTPQSIGSGEVEVDKNGTFRCFLPLCLSAVLGAMQAKYLPLFLTGSLLLEIELAPHPTVSDIVDSTECNYKITNVKLHTELLEFDATINTALTTMCQQSGLYLHANCWSSYANSISSQGQSILINERLKSVKSVFQTFGITRGKNDKGVDNAQVATPWHNRSQARSHGYVDGFQLKFGSNFYPTHKLIGKSDKAEDNGEYLYELEKALGHYSDLNHSSIINNLNFADNSSLVNSCGKAVYAIDTDLFTSEPLESGINTILNNPLLILLDQTAVFKGTAYTHLLYDAIFTISPSGSFTVSK
jgi:hypothetical protein